MKKLFAAALMLVALVSWSQVRILSLTRSGTLTWTNWVGPGMSDPFPDSAPGYRVEWAPSVTGSWNGVTNTSQTSISVGALPGALPDTFYRIAWTNGQVWSYQGYDGASLIVTGKLYFNVNDSGAYFDGGAYRLKRTGAPGSVDHRIGTNTLDSCLEDCEGRVYFAPYAIDDSFWLDGPTPTSMVWTGFWYFSKFAGSQLGGPFVAEKIEN
jgi:hypothetical protein